jgi:hypothetical protein
MDTTDKLTQDLLKELFEYRDGVLYWKVSKATNIKVGDAAGYLNSNGYFYTKVNKKKYLNHRLIFLMHHGYLPQFLDHIDGNRVNNKIENLRPATPFENNRNARTRKDNTSGIKGVYWNKRAKKWMAKIKINKERKHIGCFKTLEEAAEAIKKAREELHGEFARHE